MNFGKLLEGLIPDSEQHLKITDALEINNIALDSRSVKSGDLFIALAGAKQHGLTHINEVINKGAVATLFDPSGDGSLLAKEITGIPSIPIVNLGLVLGELAARFYGHPSKRLCVIGITGTNGKTSCSQFLGQALDDCGIVGTLGWGEWGRLNKTLNTTPDALTVQQILAEFVVINKKAVAMEVSSHGLDQGRVKGVYFEGAVFTNISRDHLDYHGTMDSYLAAKLKLLQAPGLRFAVVNLDDESCNQIIAAVPESVVIWGVSTQGKSVANGQSVRAEGIQHTAVGIEFNALWQGNAEKITASIFGDFNAENLLCVLAVMLAMGHTLIEAALKLQAINPVIGRMERCGTKASGLNVFIDYAHTPDALYRVLVSLRKHCQNKLWVVFGCGGNRDVGKRPQMGSIAEQGADQVIVTDDNPRFEDNVTIANGILAGCRLGKVILIHDRKLAIQHAINNAAEKDCIVIAGKGHEMYQEINGIQYPFHDKQVAEEALQRRFGMQ